MSGQQQTLDLGRPALVARTTDLATVPPSQHKCGECQHLENTANPHYLVCTHIIPRRRTRRYPTNEACPKFAPEGGAAK